MAEAAHVRLHTVDKRALLRQAWLWHIYHVLRLDYLSGLLAGGIHARDALGFTLDPAASVPALVYLPAKLILFSIVAEAWDDLAHRLFQVDVVLWRWNTVSS